MEIRPGTFSSGFELLCYRIQGQAAVLCPICVTGFKDKLLSCVPWLYHRPSCSPCQNRNALFCLAYSADHKLSACQVLSLRVVYVLYPCAITSIPVCPITPRTILWSPARVMCFRLLPRVAVIVPRVQGV